MSHLFKVLTLLLSYRNSRFLSLRLVAAGIAFGLLWGPFGLNLPSTAQMSDIAILTQNRSASSDSSFPLLFRSEEVLLSSLKQVTPDFSTIQLEELTNFKGKLLVVPLSDQTPQAFLDALLKKKEGNSRFMLLPMLMMPNPRIEAFLEQMGFPLSGSRYLPRSLPLMIGRKQLDRHYIPVGSFVLRTASPLPALASWGDEAPAAVVSGKAMLINWNWISEPPTGFIPRMLEQWSIPKEEKAPLSIASSSLSGLQPIPTPERQVAEETEKSEKRKESSKAEIAQLIGQHAMTPVQWGSVTSLPALQSQNIALAESPAAQKPQSMEVTAPSPAPKTATASVAAKAKPDEAATDSNPEELYQFDPASEAAYKKRNIDTQNAMADYYNERMRELADLQDKANLLAGRFMSSPDRYAAIHGAIESSNREKSKFEYAWFQRNFEQALTAFDQSKAFLMNAMFSQVPGTKVEGRAIWLDRGSIVESGSPDGLRKLIRRIAASGLNVIFFETVNAGYPIYPSRFLAQNPQTLGWDPLAVAVDEAHKQGIELHAWVWVFAVGNTRHNKILGQPDSFPGPILSKSELASEAMLGKNGERVLSKQYEYWLSPASFKARRFLIDLFSEITANYRVDGLQLDYIRYPFQKPDSPMGLESFAQGRFQAETGLSLSAPNEYTSRAWAAWKAFQVTTFVKELSESLKRINPELKISAAVFPLPRYNRMTMIQQDWETWVRNGWVDILSPMAYSRSSRSLERLVQYIHNVSDDKVLVYPGLSLSKLNAVELLDTLEICRKTGVMGTTLFAVAQLDSDKQALLKTGPYKQRETLPPHRSPLSSSIEMVSEVQGVINGILQSGQLYSGMENLLQINESLTSINNALNGLFQNKGGMQSALLVSGVRDDSRLLKQKAEQWSEWSGDAVRSFQAQVVKQMVDKVVRMVNYATFQLSMNRSIN